MIDPDTSWLAKEISQLGFQEASFSRTKSKSPSFLHQEVEFGNSDNWLLLYNHAKGFPIQNPHDLAFVW
jgi:hypothetical protein